MQNSRDLFFTLGIDLLMESCVCDGQLLAQKTCDMGLCTFGGVLGPHVRSLSAGSSGRDANFRGGATTHRVDGSGRGRLSQQISTCCFLCTWLMLTCWCAGRAL